MTASPRIRGFYPQLSFSTGSTRSRSCAPGCRAQHCASHAALHHGPSSCTWRGSPAAGPSPSQQWCRSHRPRGRTTGPGRPRCRSPGLVASARPWPRKHLRFNTPQSSHTNSRRTAPRRRKLGGGEGRERGARGRRAPAPSSPVAKPIAPAAATALPAATPAAAPRASRAAAAAGRTEAVGEHQLLEGANLLKLHTTARPRAADQTSAQTLRRPGPARGQTNPTHPSVTTHKVTTMIAGKSCGFVFFVCSTHERLGRFGRETRVRQRVRFGRGEEQGLYGAVAVCRGAARAPGARRPAARAAGAGRGGEACADGGGRAGGHGRGGWGATPWDWRAGGAGKGGGGGGRTSQGVGQGSVRPAAMSR